MNARARQKPAAVLFLRLEDLGEAQACLNECLTQVREQVRVAIGRLMQDVPICIRNGIKPLLNGIGALLSSFFANGADLLAREEPDQASHRRCDRTYKSDYRLPVRIVD